MSSVIRLSRRERLRVETSAEIKSIALAHVAANGAATVSLRAIAREMGMTPGALYSYFDTRDALVVALVADVYNSLAETLEIAVAKVPADPALRVLAYGRAYRRWAVANPEKFRLVYGDPVPHHEMTPGSPAAEAEHRACSALTGIIAAAWKWAAPLHESSEWTWADFNAEFAELIRSTFPDLPPSAVMLALRVWGRLHGPVSLEVNGHLSPQTKDPEKLFDQELHDLIAMLGLEQFR